MNRKQQYGSTRSERVARMNGRFEALWAAERSKAGSCVTCGEPIGHTEAAEVCRGGRHVIVHVECMLPGEEVA